MTVKKNLLQRLLSHSPNIFISVGSRWIRLFFTAANLSPYR